MGSRASVHVPVASEDKCLNKKKKYPSSCSFLLSFIADVIWYVISFWSAWVSCPGYVPSQSLAHSKLTGCWGWGWKMGWKESSCCGSTAQQLPNHWCVISTPLATNTKHSTMRAAVGKVNSIPARPNTVTIQ